MFSFLIKKASAAGLGTEFAPQASVTGGSDSMTLFWIVAGILVVAGIAGLFAYKTFFD
ncbi:MAG: hypothetical protein WC164_03855 [Patescibacteria group bacterium]|jgi:hypothetical protein